MDNLLVCIVCMFYLQRRTSDNSTNLNTEQPDVRIQAQNVSVSLYFHAVDVSSMCSSVASLEIAPQHRTKNPKSVRVINERL